MIGCMALQQPDLDRLSFSRLADTGLLAQGFVGQTLAHMPPRMFCSKMVRAEPSTLPVEICRMNFGMSIAVGQAVTQGAS